MILNPKVIYKTMNIKNIIRNQSVRHFLLKLFAWLPDRVMLPLQYWLILRRKLDMKNPKRFTEWLQWYKVYYRNNEMPQCTDKYLVRDFVINQLGTDKYLNKLYQVCDNAKDLNFDKFPNKFVIKTTDGGNGDNVYICRDKNSINIEDDIRKINSWRHKHYENLGREWAYTGATNSQIIVEEYLEDENSIDGSIDDYKFLCFNGKFKYLWIDKNRYSDHRRGFWNENLNFMPHIVSDHPTFDVPPTLPDNIQEMIDLSERLSSKFLFARVDWYNINGKIIFGEITFYPWSGYVQYNPDEFDFTLGNCFKVAAENLQINI